MSNEDIAHENSIKNRVEGDGDNAS